MHMHWPTRPGLVKGGWKGAGEIGRRKAKRLGKHEHLNALRELALGGGYKGVNGGRKGCWQLRRVRGKSEKGREEKRHNNEGPVSKRKLVANRSF